MAKIIIPDMVGDKVRLDLPSPLSCIACGCDEEHACVISDGPCAWAAIDEVAGVGLCTACAVKPLAELEWLAVGGLRPIE